MDSEGENTNLIVNYLPLSFRERHLRKMFSEFGTINSCQVMRFEQRGKILSKGYGFVDFATAEEAKNALLALNGHNTMGKKIKVGFAKTSNKRVKSSLFVSQIPERWTEADLEEVFGEHGTVSECSILRDAQGFTQQCAFVRFQTHNQAKRAIHHLNQTHPMPQDQEIDVRFATDDEINARKQTKSHKAQATKRGNRRKKNKSHSARSCSGQTHRTRSSISSSRSYETSRTMKDSYIPLWREDTPPLRNASRNFLECELQDWETPFGFDLSRGFLADDYKPFSPRCERPYLSASEYSGYSSPPLVAPYLRHEHTVHLTNTPSFLDAEAIQNMCSVYADIVKLETTTDNNGRRVQGFFTLYLKNEDAVQKVVAAFDGCQLGGRILRCSPGTLA